MHRNYPTHARTCPTLPAPPVNMIDDLQILRMYLFIFSAFLHICADPVLTPPPPLVIPFRYTIY